MYVSGILLYAGRMLQRRYQGKRRDVQHYQGGSVHNHRSVVYHCRKTKDINTSLYACLFNVSVCYYRSSSYEFCDTRVTWFA